MSNTNATVVRRKTNGVSPTTHAVTTSFDTDQFNDLAAGDWAFAVTAVDMAGNESDFSEPLTVEVGP